MARRRGELVTSADGAVRADRDADSAGSTELLPMVPEQEAGGIEILERGEIVAGPAERPEDVLAEPPDARDISAELAAPPRRKLPWLTLILAACVVAAGAFSAGALVEKHQGGGSGSNPFAALASARGGTGTGTGTGGRTFGGFGGGASAGTGTGTGTGTGSGTGAAGGVTFGTVKLVDGSTIYVTDAQGNIVKVTTGGSTKVSETKEGKVSDLKAGQTVTVRGTAGSNGDIAATTVTQGSIPAGGFGGFGGQGAGGTGAGGTGGAAGGN
ncbi:hypothetical protein OG552_18790 [Streptomyces sp. NBC_01476]|uniref:hypothetical protein n=1 Tax=Streptomyces sp. NBC_01476 TaxID=2903881 RepID=UPI002E2F1F94|nr:hypothetical protein [Streptomyces sp. NBC_01476]